MKWRRWRTVRRVAFSATAFRIFNAILLLLLCTDAPRVLETMREWSRYFDAIRQSNMNALRTVNTTRWASVDIQHPPPLFNTTIEALRVNELLASASADAKTFCAAKIRYGADTDAFVLCADASFSISNASESTDTSRKIMLLTNRKNLRGTFERSLNATRWTIFAPTHSNIFDLLAADLEVHYLVNSNDGDEQFIVPVVELLDELSTQQFAIAKIDLVDTDTQKSHQLLRKILTELRTEQLLVVVHLERRDTSLLYDWYSRLFRILSDARFVLLHAEASGACGADLEYFRNCEYRLTFVNREKIASRNILAPSFGLGSPMEEKYRLLKHLLTVSSEKAKQCEEKQNTDFDQIPMSCLLAKQNVVDSKKCKTLVYIRYRVIANQKAWNEMASGMRGICTEFNLFYPHKIENSKINVPPEITHFSYGVSSNNRSEFFSADLFDESLVWKLESLNNLLKQAQVLAYTKNILIMDLDGGEGTVFDNLLGAADNNLSVCARFRDFEWIVIRLRLWMAEEAQNFRRLYSNLVQLENVCEYYKAHTVTYDTSTYSITYHRNAII